MTAISPIHPPNTPVEAYAAIVHLTHAVYQQDAVRILTLAGIRPPVSMELAVEAARQTVRQVVSA